MDDWNKIMLWWIIFGAYQRVDKGYIWYEQPLKDLCFLSANVFRLLG